MFTNLAKHNNGIKGDGKKPPRLMPGVEPVGKVSDQVFSGEVQKSDLLNGSTIDDHILGKGQEILEISFKIVKVPFPTGSLGSR